MKQNLRKITIRQEQVRLAKENTKVLTDYLLGRLSAEERDRVERDYLADNNLHEELIAVESELLDSYVCGELSIDEGKYLIGNLGPDAIRDRIPFAHALANLTRRLEPPVTQVPSSMHRFGRRTLFAIPVRVQFMLACLAAVVIIASVAVKRWSVFPPKVVAIHSPSVAAPIDKGLPIIDAVLFPLERGTGQQASVTLPRERRSISLRLIVSASEKYPEYVAKVEAVGGSWSHTFTGLRPTQTAANEKRLELRIDSAQLKPGDYKISLSGMRGSSEDLAAGYFFRVKME